ncbi:hypothetical protein H6501_04680 [Candidatus Woesearchaeota archaeon]|nr:hypothetical protein [Nanoarchaeota archaeon]MCB9370868.1 hypothetical protein [Candidatus Woesearchaeota archaeon]USN43970.1 MAG: hypothetical protein H6500_06290 [Candidatus Woesearchaeota archaeon]
MEEKKGVGVFTTHNFLFTLHYEGKLRGHILTLLDKDNSEKNIEIDSIEIGASPVSCKIYDPQGKRHIVPFMRVLFVKTKNGELVWDNSERDFSQSKIIKGY